MPLPIVHHPGYRAPLDPNHRFPMGKFGRVFEILLEEGLVAPGGHVQPVEAPPNWLRLAHDTAYVDQVMTLTVPPDVARRIGFPMTAEVARRSRLACAGTLLTARLALEQGLACNTAGGSHHAARPHGAGFCVFNDVGVAASVLLAEGAVSRILVVDLDVHQGDGTAQIFADEPRVFTFSMHAEKNFPARKMQSYRDVPLPDGMEDADYLSTLATHLPDLLTQVRPDLVFYNAGVDPHRDDRLGRLALSDAGIARRDAYVLETCLAVGVPLAGVLGGGYDRDVDVVARRHAILHRTAAGVFARRRL
ncbi:histone deacetylase family protein [Futiania mangrovi]|uniref:Histone deacetylase n=1 Tax=Futiania mangrovi TaxID=2959716 RepID=A0A9J6PAR6_9PROT|nr:histone deacetylase [Futiania mangrovii]MCP1336205.1 histone deacetylase [Futiania mangrovii]